MTETKNTSDKSAEEAKSKPPKSARWFTSYLLALGMVGAVGLWFASGEIVIGGQGVGDQSNNAPQGSSKNEVKIAKIDSKDQTRLQASKDAPSKTQRDASLFKVSIRTFRPEPRQAELVLRGRTQANKRVMVSSETSGLVSKVAVEKGTFVKAGTLICQLENGIRVAKLAEAKAKLKESQSRLNASSTLAKRGYTSKLKVIEGQATLDAAKAAVKQMQLELEHTKIIAPFDGTIELQDSKAGTYLNTGQQCATLVSLSPLLVVGAISERDVASIRIGMAADAQLITGERVRGKIKFISPSSDTATRTFRIEVEIPNPKRTLRDGVTTDIKIPLPTQTAHRLPTSILALADNGDIGVRVLDENNAVRFKKIKILSDQRGGVWVNGLKGPTRVITVGQEYVGEGQIVEPVQQPDATILRNTANGRQPATQ